jgi:hypothetical protein
MTKHKLSAIEIYDIMYDVAMTVNGTTSFYEYKTTSRGSLTVPPGAKMVIKKITMLTCKPLKASPSISVGQRSFCHCPLKVLMRDGCHCGGT